MRYVRSQAWLWATLVSAAVAYLLFMGPTEVLLPFVVKNELRGGAGDLGLVFAAGGLGSLRVRDRDRPARAAPAQHHVHVHHLDRWRRSRLPATGSRTRSGG